MEHVLGIGGYFLRAADPAALNAWYRDCLGLDADENGAWRQGAGLTVFATFESETDYFGSRSQQVMMNFRVRDLAAIVGLMHLTSGSLLRVQLVPFLLFLNLMLLLNWVVFALIGMHRAATGQTFTYPMTLGRT